MPTGASALQVLELNDVLMNRSWICKISFFFPDLTRLDLNHCDLEAEQAQTLHIASSLRSASPNNYRVSSSEGISVCPVAVLKVMQGLGCSHS